MLTYIYVPSIREAEIFRFASNICVLLLLYSTILYTRGYIVCIGKRESEKEKKKKKHFDYVQYMYIVGVYTYNRKVYVMHFKRWALEGEKHGTWLFYKSVFRNGGQIAS